MKRDMSIWWILSIIWLIRGWAMLLIHLHKNLKSIQLPPPLLGPFNLICCLPVKQLTWDEWGVAAHEWGIYFFITPDSLSRPSIVTICWKKNNLCLSHWMVPDIHCFDIGATVCCLALIVSLSILIEHLQPWYFWNWLWSEPFWHWSRHRQMVGGHERCQQGYGPDELANCQSLQMISKSLRGRMTRWEWW